MATRTEIKNAAKGEIFSQLLNCQEFGREMIQSTNIVEDEDGSTSPRWTPEEVEAILAEMIEQSERAIKFLGF